MSPFLRITYKRTLLLWLWGASVSFSGSYLTVDGTYDFNENTQSEVLIFGGESGSIRFIELDSVGNHVLIWEYTPSKNQFITDVKISDLDRDEIPELLAGVITIADDGKASQPWLLVFPWEGRTFATSPKMLNNMPGTTDRYRPLNLTPTEGLGQIAVSLSSPSRKVVLTTLDISNSEINLINSFSANTSIITNGYGPVYTGVFRVNGRSFLTVLSPEGNIIKTALFSIERDLKEVTSDVLVANGARGLLGPAIQAYDGDRDGNEELLLPFETGDVLALSFDGENLKLEKSKFHEKGLFALPKKSNANQINNRLLSRIEEGLYESSFLTASAEPSLTSLPKDTIMLGDTLDHHILPDSLMEFYGFQWRKPPPSGMHFDPKTLAIKWIPRRSNLGLAEAAYNLEIRTEEKLISTLDHIGDRHQMTSVIKVIPDSMVLFVGDTLFIQKKLSPMVFVTPRYYSVNLFSTKLSDSDRYVFEGEPPYGVNTALFPDSLKGTYTSIKANLNSINIDKTAHFTFKSKEEAPENIATLSLIHDMENNVLYSSIQPPLDSLPQSFHPEDWSSDLFTFPEYFYEGFPMGMDIDTTSTGLKFSLPKYRAHEEGVVGLTSPLGDNHEFQIYYTGGLPYAVRGEVRVKENGFHKTMTKIDFTEFFRPLRIVASFSPEEKDTIVFYPDTTTRDTSFNYSPAIELITKPEIQENEKSGIVEQEEIDISVVPTGADTVKRNIQLDPTPPADLLNSSVIDTLSQKLTISSPTETLEPDTLISTKKDSL